MLLTELILSKRGPLAKVWLSAHQERKLSKQQTLGVDVGESVDAILEQDEGPIALRLSGQLMLGVTRIYSRKVQYLLDDCKETRERITLAFRPGIVDLPQDQIRASKNAITFAEQPNDFNFLDWSWTAAPLELTRGLHTVPDSQINLRPATREFGAFNFGRPTVPSIYGRSSPSRHGSQDDSTSHLDSQDFSGVDLGLTGEGDIEMEDVREVRSHMSREGSVGFGKRAPSFDVQDQGDFGGAEMSFEGVDLGLELGDQPELPALEERSRRESSALSTPPPLSPQPVTAEVTPRTAARMQRAEAPPKVKKPRMLHADRELELPDEDFAPPGRDSAILTEARYMPSDPEIIRLREIAENPTSHFLPTIRVGGTDMIYAGPEGLAPELAELFAFPASTRRGREEDQAGPSPKRPRIEAEEEAEVGRRGSILPPSEHGFDFGGDQTFDTIVPGDDFGHDVPAFDLGGLATPRKEASLAPSRAESIAREIQFGDIPDHPLAMFDARRGESQSIYETPTKSSAISDDRRSAGFSKNTGMAMGLLRKEIEAIEGDVEADKVVSFEALADRASKKAASAFFFELLVLGTKDCVRLEQDRAFGEIKIRSKPRLFQELDA